MPAAVALFSFRVPFSRFRPPSQPLLSADSTSVPRPDFWTMFVPEKPPVQVIQLVRLSALMMVTGFVRHTREAETSRLVAVRVAIFALTAAATRKSRSTSPLSSM